MPTPTATPVKGIQESRLTLEQRLEQLDVKYCDLVWFARNASEGKKPLHSAGAPAVARIAAKYPRETDMLQDFEWGEPEWHDGFNSGVLAAVRLLAAYAMRDDYVSVSYVDGAIEEGNLFEDLDPLSDEVETFWTKSDQIRQAEEDFPMLDT